MKPEVVAWGACRVGVRLAAYEVVLDRAWIGVVVAAVVVRAWPLDAEVGGKGGGGGGDG